MGEKCSEDALLRKHGYRILSRPEKGEATWMLACGLVHTHSQAIRRVIEWRVKMEAEKNK